MGLIAGSAARVLVAEAGGSVAGAVVASFDGWRARIYHVAVAPARRRRGLGRALVEEAELHLAGEGAQRVRLIVGDGDEAALALAASAGYVRQRGAQLVKVLTVDLQTPEREVRWTLATGFRMPVLDRHELEQARRRFPARHPHAAPILSRGSGAGQSGGDSELSGFTVTRPRVTEPVFVKWCWTSGGTSTASPCSSGYSFPSHQSTPEPSTMNAWCSHAWVWWGLEAPGACCTYSST